MSVQEIETAIVSLPPDEQARLSRWLRERETKAAVMSDADLSAAYREMAQDREREQDALAWAELGAADVGRGL